MSVADTVLRASQAFGRGDVAASVGLMREAVRAQRNADNLYALGRCQRAAEDFTGAEASYREALALRPEFADAWISLGIVMRATERAAEAIDCQRTALRIDSANFTAHLNLGNSLLAVGRHVEAAESFRATLALNDDCAEAHNNLARLLKAQGDLTNAGRHYVRALAINPRYFEAALGVGMLLLERADYADAVEPLTLASRLRPDDRPARKSLGRALSGAGRYPAAINEFETVLRSIPGDRDTRYDLALAQFYSGQYTKPRTTLENLVAEGGDAFVRLAYASLLLRNGEFREGWRHYEARRKTQPPGRRTFVEPEWQGENLAGRTVLITREQGLGDEIMFASIFGEVIAEAGHAIIECEQRLVPLYRRTFPDSTVYGVDKDDPHWYERLAEHRATLPAFDCWTTLGDLGRLRRGESASFPRHAGYLSADPVRVARWRARFAADRGGKPQMTVGFGWRGGTKTSRTGERSISLADLKPLLALPNFRFVSLQYGPCAQEVADFARANHLNIDHWQESIDDIDDYAALIASLDLVVSVCSAVIHLGGALGRPVWVMAPEVPEWRYGRTGESMIWYPSVRMYRQDRSRSWGKVISHVRRDLAKLAPRGPS